MSLEQNISHSHDVGAFRFPENISFEFLLALHRTSDSRTEYCWCLSHPRNLRGYFIDSIVIADLDLKWCDVCMKCHESRLNSIYNIA
jgi:hypothetical protein